MEEDDKSAPSQAEWLDVLHSKDPKNVARAKKLNVMRWCFGLRFQTPHAGFLRRLSICISIQQDARGNRFLSRFKMVDSELEILEGTLSLAKHAGTVEQPGSVGIRRRTMLALEKLATGPPPPTYSAASPQSIPAIDKELYRQLVQKVGGFCCRRSP